MKKTIIKGQENMQPLLKFQKTLKEYSNLLKKSEFKAFELEMKAEYLPHLELNKVLKQHKNKLEELENSIFKLLLHLEIRIENANNFNELILKG